MLVLELDSQNYECICSNRLTSGEFCNASWRTLARCGLASITNRKPGCILDVYSGRT